MKVNGRVSALFSVAAVLAFGGGAASLQAAPATKPAASCTSNAPCFQEDNAGTGSGVKGTSAKGNGIEGTTHARGTTANNTGFGVLGQDLQTSTNDILNAGVEGTSLNGTGVLGSSNAGSGVSGSSASGDGVHASSQSGHAVFGSVVNGTAVEGVSSQSIGVRGIGSSSIGVIGDGLTGIEGETTGGTAVLGRTSGAGEKLFRGSNHNQVDVFSIDDSGNAAIAGSAIITGKLTDATEIDVTSTNVGLHATAANDGIIASATGPGTSILAINQNVNADLFRGHNSANVDKFIVNDAGDTFAHSFHSTLGFSNIQKTASGPNVYTYAPAASQPSLEDFGEAQLVNGVASVQLDPAFASAIDRTAGYLVMVTPEGDCRGLYVAQRGPTGFTVRELQGGRTSIAFTYRIVGKPFGSPAQRLPLANSVPRGFDRPTR